MVSVGQEVIIHPGKTLIFGGEKGTVIEIDPTSALPIKVKLHNRNSVYCFNEDELIIDNIRHPQTIDAKN